MVRGSARLRTLVHRNGCTRPIASRTSRSARGTSSVAARAAACATRARSRWRSSRSRCSSVRATSCSAGCPRSAPSATGRASATSCARSRRRGNAPGSGSTRRRHPAFALMAALSTVLFGDTDLARTLVVVGAIPLGAWGVFRLTRPLAALDVPRHSRPRSPTRSNPLPRNALAQGRLGSLDAVRARAVRAVGGVARAAGTGHDRRRLRAVRHRAPRRDRRPAVLDRDRRRLLPGGRAVRPAASRSRSQPRSRSPAARVTPGVSRWSHSPRSWVPRCCSCRGRSSWFDGDGAALGLAVRHVTGLSDVLRFSTGPAGAGWAPWGLLVAGALPAAGRERCPPRVGRARVDARRRVVRAGVAARAARRVVRRGPNPRACSSAPRSGSRSRPGSASPRSPTTCAGSSSGGGSSPPSSAAFGDAAPRRRLRGRRHRRPVARARRATGPKPSRGCTRTAAHGDFRVLWFGDADVLPGGRARCARHCVRVEPGRRR